MKLTDKYRLDSLEVDGFRGYLNSFEFPAAGRAVMLLGPQGTGKTSTLAAIEWCLFGQLAYFRSAESKTDVELVNANKVDESCKVTLRLRRGNENIEIGRTKRARERDTTLSLKTASGEWSGDEAEQKVFTTLGLTFDDFYRSVYLHQESIRGLITDEPSRRDEAVDRLLGLERARNLSSAIPLRDVRKAMEELTQKKTTLESEIAGATRQVQSELENAQQEAAEQGLEGKEISLENAIDLSRGLQGLIGDLAKENGLDRPEFAGDQDLTVLSRTVSKAKSFFRECRGKVIEITNVDAIREKRGPLQDLMDQLKRIDMSGADAKKALGKLVDRVGQKSGLDKQLAKQNANIEELESRRTKLDASSRLAEDALVVFEGAMPTVCPVCGQSIQPESVKKHLRELLEAGKKKQLDAITAGIKASKKRIDELDQAAGEFEKLQEALRTVESDLEGSLKEAAELLGRKLGLKQIRTDLNSELNQVEKELEKAQRAYKRREEAIAKAESIAEKIKVIHLVLQKKDEFRALQERFSAESEQITGLSDRIMDLDAFRVQLERVVAALNSVQIELAEDSVSKGRNEMERLYSELEAHPYYSNFQIDVSTKNVAGVQKNTYQLRAFSPKDGKKTYVSARFSTGQMNCAALAIFFALSRLASHSLGFLILDDPSQNLDSNHKAALAKVLRRLAGEKQLFVATQDEELQTRLRDSFKPGKDVCLAEFKSWDKKGPTITMRP